MSNHFQIVHCDCISGRNDALNPMKIRQARGLKFAIRAHRLFRVCTNDVCMEGSRPINIIYYYFPFVFFFHSIEYLFYDVQCMYGFTDKSQMLWHRFFSARFSHFIFMTSFCGMYSLRSKKKNQVLRTKRIRRKVQELFY